MIKKISLLLAVVMLFGATFALTGCNKEKYDKFVALEGDTSGETLDSNGGIAVIKGDYLYYVNGTYTFDANIPNKFGNVLEGCVLRISTSKFAEIMDAQANQYALAKQKEADAAATYAAEEAIANALEGETAQKEAKGAAQAKQIAAQEEAKNMRTAAVAATTEAIKANAFVVVPKIVYYDSADSTLNGIYIYGERLYYMTPDASPDKNGRVQNERLVLMSVKLNGTDTKAHYTFEDFDILSTSTTREKLALCLTQFNGKAYAMYVSSNTLRVIDLTSEKSKISHEVANVYNAKFDQANGRVFYTNESASEIWYYNAGAEKGEKVNDSAVSLGSTAYTFNSICDGKLYVSTTEEFFEYNNTVSVIDVNAVPQIKRLSGVVKSGFLAYENYTIYPDESNTQIAIYDTVGSKVKHTVAVASGTTVKLEFIEEGYLYYTTTKDTVNKLYRINLLTIDWEAENLTSQEIATIASGTHWARYDFCGSYLFNFETTSIDVKIGENTHKFFDMLCMREADFTTDTTVAIIANISKHS